MKYVIENCPAYYINTCNKVKEQYCSNCSPYAEYRIKEYRNMTKQWLESESEE